MMDNNFYDGLNNSSDENIQSQYGNNSNHYSNSFTDSNYQSYINTNNSFNSNVYGGAYNNYGENRGNYGYAKNQPLKDNNFGGYGQNHFTDNNAYSGYTQNKSYQNDENIYNNPNIKYGVQINDSNQNKYISNNTTHNNDCINNDYEYSHCKINIKKNYKEYLDSADPKDAEIVYKDKNKSDVFLRYVGFLVFFMFIGVPYSTKYLDTTATNIALGVVFPVIFFGYIVFMIIAGAILPAINLLKNKKRCTQNVTAKIIDIRVSRDKKGHKYYFPTFKYSYAGKIYFITGSPDIYRQVGCEIQMYINPNRPTDYYTQGKMPDFLMVLLLVMGVAMALIPTGILISMLSRFFS